MDSVAARFSALSSPIFEVFVVPTELTRVGWLVCCFCGGFFVKCRGCAVHVLLLGQFIQFGPFCSEEVSDGSGFERLLNLPLRVGLAVVLPDCLAQGKNDGISCSAGDGRCYSVSTDSQRFVFLRGHYAHYVG